MRFVNQRGLLYIALNLLDALVQEHKKFGLEGCSNTLTVAELIRLDFHESLIRQVFREGIMRESVIRR